MAGAVRPASDCSSATTSSDSAPRCSASTVASSRSSRSTCCRFTRQSAFLDVGSRAGYRHPMLRTRVVSAACIAGALCGVPLSAMSAQVVRGKVVDADSNIGLAGATISVVGENAASRSDDSGKFVLVLHRPGSVVMTVRRLGYAQQTWTFAMMASDIADAVLPIRSMPPQLDTVNVNAATTGALHVADFE